MPDWLVYAAVSFTLSSGLTWWWLMTRLARRDLERRDRWRQREDEQILRWSHVERCSACTARLNE